MAYWASKGMGISFGGVFDSYDADEEDLTSSFFNELYGYQIANGPNGKWISLNLKRPKQKKKGPGKAKLKKMQQRQQEEEARRRKEEEEEAEAAQAEEPEDDEDKFDDGDSSDSTSKTDAKTPMGITNGHTIESSKSPSKEAYGESLSSDGDSDDDDPDDPQKTIPIARYNAMMAVQKNTLYIYGGIVEAQEREYTLDDFYTLQLDKLERYTCLKECNIAELEWKESDDDEDDEDDSDSESGSSGSDEEDEEQDEITPHEHDDNDPGSATIDHAENEPENRAPETSGADLRLQATAFMGVAKSAERTQEDVMSTPLPGETLKTFYDRTRE